MVRMNRGHFIDQEVEEDPEMEFSNKPDDCDVTVAAKDLVDKYHVSHALKYDLSYAFAIL